LKLTSEEDEEATELVIREVKKRKETHAVMEKALLLAKEIEIPAEVLTRESTAEAAQLGLELIENLQQMAMTGNLVESEADGMAMEAAEVNQEEAGCSEAPGVSEAPEGNSISHIAEIVEIGSSTSSETRSSSSSLSSSSSTSSDPNDIPLSKIYSTLNKDLSPSPSTKTSKKPDYDTFVPMYPSIEERLIGLQQRRIDACIHLPVDHPLQPPMIEPIQSLPADAKGADDHTGTNPANINVSSSTPNSPTQITQTHEPSIIPDLEKHYSGELPGYVSNQEKASNIASDEVMTESPQQLEPNQEIASTTNLDSVLIPEPISKQSVPELVVLEKPSSELSAPEQVINSQSTTTNTPTEPETSVNDQPSSSNLEIQHVAHSKTNVPSPPTLFLNSTILANVCENIF